MQTRCAMWDGKKYVDSGYASILATPIKPTILLEFDLLKGESFLRLMDSEDYPPLITIFGAKRKMRILALERQDPLVLRIEFIRDRYSELCSIYNPRLIRDNKELIEANGVIESLSKIDLDIDEKAYRDTIQAMIALYEGKR